MSSKLEICCYSAESAILSEKAGADRIELCDNFSEGGTTPSYATVKYTVANVNLPIYVIIRPRGGDFLYTDVEFEIMKAEVSEMKALGVQGIVFGILKSSGEIDVERTKEIIELTAPMDATFHRAFDMSKDHLKSLETLKELGISRVLTSGGKKTAFEGMELLTKLVEAAEDQIIVMPGSGINEKNIGEIIHRTGAKEFHASAKTFVKSGMDYVDPTIKMGKSDSMDEYKKISVNSEQIKMMNKILKK